MIRLLLIGNSLIFLSHLFSCVTGEDNSRSREYRYELRDSIEIKKYRKTIDHKFFHRIDGKDYHSIHYAGEKSISLYEIGSSDTAKFILPNRVRLTNGNSTFLNDSTFIYLTNKHGYENVLELLLVGADDSYKTLVDTFHILDTSYMTWTYSTKLVNLKSFGNHIFIPVWTKENGSDWTYPSMHHNGHKHAGAPCELHYRYNVKNGHLEFLGVLGAWPAKYVNRHHMDVWYHRNFFRTKSGDSCAVVSFSESDTVFIYGIEGSLRNTMQLGSSNDKDFPKTPLIPDLNVQFERYMKHKFYRLIWADEFGVYRLVTYPTGVQKNEFEKRKTYEKKCGLIFRSFNDLAKGGWHEIDYVTHKEWYPYFLGEGGLYVMSKNLDYDSIYTTTTYNRYNIRFE